MYIAIVDNISAAGYRLVRPRFPVVWMPGTPAEVADAMEGNLCDAALLPVADLPRLAARVRPLGPFGIAATGPVQTVLFVGRQPVEDLLQEGLPIHMSRASRTSRLLLRTLCRVAYGREPIETNEPVHAAGRLLIGDESLNVHRYTARYPVIVDLAEWWFHVTGLPFVFAQWVARRTLPAERRDRLRVWLEETTAPAATPEGRALMAREIVKHHRSERFALQYYSRIEYRLTTEHLVGLHAFLDLQGIGAAACANHG